MGNLGQFNKDIYKPLCGITERFSLGRISEETHLDKNEKLCYTYDVLNRVTARTVKNATTDAVISTETFTYDAAGNIIGGSANILFTNIMRLLIKILVSLKWGLVPQVW